MTKLAKSPYLQWLRADSIKLYTVVSIAVGLLIVFGLCVYVFVVVLMA